MLATYGGYVETVEMLLDADCDPSITESVSSE